MIGQKLVRLDLSNLIAHAPLITLKTVLPGPDGQDIQIELI